MTYTPQPFTDKGDTRMSQTEHYDKLPSCDGRSVIRCHCCRLVQFRSPAGVCVKSGRLLLSGQPEPARKAPSSERRVVTWRDRYDRLKGLGLCPKCGIREPVSGRTCCSNCTGAMKEMAQARFEREGHWHWSARKRA